MKTIDYSNQNSILGQYLSQMRDKQIQKDPRRFRMNLERIGSFFASEISKTLNYKTIEVTTPLGIAECNVPADNIVVATILRAGLPLHNGILNVFDSAEGAFVTAYRKYGKDNKFDIRIEYVTSPSLEGKVLILADTMLATGASLLKAYERLLSHGEPLHTHFVCPVASRSAVEYLSKSLPHKKVTLWTAAIDEELTNKSYIVPGIGDAGDLCYGSKL